jgi:hypothetical protein
LILEGKGRGGETSERLVAKFLSDTLARLYTSQAAIHGVASRAGLPLEHIQFADTPRDSWIAVLHQAEVRAKVSDVLGVVIGDYSDSATQVVTLLSAAMADYPDQAERLSRELDAYRQLHAERNGPGPDQPG